MAIEQLGPYKIHHVIGRGGMGTVYSGEHDQSGDRVAVKVLSLVHSDDLNFRERFITEIESLKKLRHENIVRLIGYGEHDGHLFYAMELMREASLQNQLNDGARFSWREVAEIGIQICRALKHAHDRGVIHRDLKPANLLLDEEERIKLSDFGIAKLFGGTQLTADGGVVGTADYMAPEQSAGLPTTPRTDMFSLGCVLYALLVGRPPFAAATAAEAIHRLRYEEPPLLSRRVMDVPDEMERIIMQLLEKDPPQRIATPLALSKRLQAMMHALADDGDDGGEGDGDDSVSEDDGRVTSEDIPTMAGGTPVPAMDTAARSTVVVPGDMDASSALQSKSQSHSVEFETGVSETAIARENRFITAEEARRVDAVADEDNDYSLWIKLTAVVVLFAGVAGGIWLFTRPTSEATLYKRIKTAADAESPEKLAGLQDEIEEYLERFPEGDKAQEVGQYRDEVDLYRMRRRFERRLKRPSSGESLELVERLYLDALRQADRDPQQAIANFRAIVDVFEGDEESRSVRQSVELAKSQIQRLQKVAKTHREKTLADLRSRLQQARDVQQRDQQRAIRICRGLIHLCGNKPWAAGIVAQSQELLKSLQ